MADAKELKALKLKRNGYRLSATNQIQATKSSLNFDTVLTTSEICTLQSYVEKLHSHQSTLEILDSQILHQLPDDDAVLEQEIQKTLEVQESILDTLKLAESFLRQRAEENFIDTKSKLCHNDDYESKFSSYSVKASSAKLPKLQIASFSGDPLKWQEFWDSFGTTIGSNTDLAPIEKFKYLQSYLEGDALQAIEGYRLTADNYQVVVDTLIERFGNPEFAIYAHLERLLIMPAGDSQSVKLQKIYDECERHIRSLIALGLSEDTFGRVFTPIIMSKLPRTVRIQVLRANGSKHLELSRLREILKNEISARDMIDRYLGMRDIQGKNESTKSNKTSAYNAKSKKFLPTQTALVNNNTQLKLRCSFCSEKHYSDRCTKYSTSDERRNQIKGNCFRCLGSGHNSKECKGQKNCYFCKKPNHHSSLCDAKFGKSQKTKDTKPKTEKETSCSSKNKDASLVQQSPNVLMQMAMVTFPNQKIRARILFDTGSSRSYITSSLCESLQPTMLGEETIAAAQFGSKRRKYVSYKQTALDIPTRDSKLIPIEFLVTDSITCPLQKYPLDTGIHPILANIPLADVVSETKETVTVDILIGSDNYCQLIGHERISLNDNLFLIESKFGYIPTGKVYHEKADHYGTALLNHASHPSAELNFDLEKFWSLEDMGIKDNPYQNDDEKAINSFNASIRSVDGRYEVGWPWKEDNPDLPSNLGLAMGRLQSLLNRIKQQPNVIKEYSKIIDGQFTNGVVEKVNSVDTDNHKIHYIPHHCVIRENKATTKLRVVYDASSRASKGSLSLNDCLLRGPVILQNLCGMLIRFRIPKIAVTCDVEKAFLQVGLRPEDRDVTRFSWLKDPMKPIDKTNLITYRFCRVPFGMISSPFLLAATIKHHLLKQNTPVSKNILRNIYVDIVLGGCQTLEEIIKYYEESKLLFSNISMNIREWYSNSSQFSKLLRPDDQGRDKTPEVLGMNWHLESDTMSCQGFSEKSEMVTSKRTILKAVSTIYDPCGFASPVTLRGKVLVQEIWKLNLPWDQEVPSGLKIRFNSILDDLLIIKNIQIPRIISKNVSANRAKHQLHCFCDASATAYAAAVYLRSEAVNGKTSCGLLFSKARVAPVKQVSIPRLELMGVVLGSRIASFVKAEIDIPISQTIVWTDSKCTLHSLNSSKILPVFVQNRVLELKKHSEFQYRYVPTLYNPADIPSRGTSCSDLQNSELWWYGPKFLCTSDTLWPEDSITHLDNYEETEPQENTLLLSAETHTTGIGEVIDITRYSSLNKLFRVTAYILRFIQRCSQNIGNTQNLRSNNATSAEAGSVLNKLEILAAETVWVKFIQTTSLPPFDNKQKPYHGLNPYKNQDGIIRCKGRLPEVLEDVSHPKLLPKDHKYTKLVIHACHKSLLHAGARQTSAQVRYEYWIPSGYSQVQKVLRECQVCRKIEGCPVKYPVSPPLPYFQASRCVPFTYTGVDYTGPLFIKKNDSTEKVWMCLFTCAVIRAIHLEVAEDLSAEQFLLCLRRFCAIYGTPSIIISDNGTQFKAVNTVLQTIVKSEVVQTYTATKGIDWKFIPESAPWMGGFYERLVGSVKRSLRKSPGKRCLTLIQLQTIVTEVSAVINARPLSALNFEVGEDALTPAHFLAKSGKIGLPDFTVENDTAFHQFPLRGLALLDSWLKGQKLLNEFWKCWKNEYLMSLRERPLPKVTNNYNTSQIPLTIGLVVLIKGNLPRSQWKMARICTIHNSHDGKFRSATVLQPNGKKLTRPVNLLYPIEDSNDPEGTTIDSLATTEKVKTRQQRQAALKARSAISDQMVEESSNMSDDN